MPGFPETIAIVGVPGVGKTTLCRILSEKLDHTFINYGELMLEIAGERSLAGTLEELFSLSLDQQHNIWREAAHRVSEMKGVVLDLHGLDRSPLGYLVSLPVEFITPDLIIILESDPHDIIKRRIADSRRRMHDTPSSLLEHMELLRTAMFVCAALMGSIVSVVENRTPEGTASEITEIIKAAEDLEILRG
ncbi:adenylate kinase [Methanothermobacter sp. K4]|uniref:adenylate kinase n=1 Tax=Methanothermobacter sp. K4 TaxID=2913262 RepID=UPI001ED9C71A|nr:adenylate kinase [Methanothermobacter sp. K4]MCG2827675.1 adenylate kinase [Methanothermobacter sp. K4]